MAKVQITNVTVLDNPSPFQNPIQFEITFECIDDLVDDLEWKIIYVGSAESEDFDQLLDSVLVGPVPCGRHMFVFQAEPPDPSKIPGRDVIGVTAVILTCSYRSREFVRVGYYVNNDYADPEMRETPPPVVRYEDLQRDIFASKPIVTRFKIDWDDPPGTQPAAQAPEDVDPNGLFCGDGPVVAAAAAAAAATSPCGGGGGGVDRNLNNATSKGDLVVSASIVADTVVGFNGCVQNGTNGAHHQEDSNCTMDTS